MTDEAEVCDLCAEPFHAEPAAEPGEFGLTCPGADAEEGVKDAFRFERDWHRSRSHIETTDWKEFGDQAKAAYSVRSRSEVAPEVLASHCDELTEIVAPAIAKNAEDDGGLDVDVPHLTVLGKVPAPSGGLVTGAEFLRSIDASDYSLYLKPDGIS